MPCNLALGKGCDTLLTSANFLKAHFVTFRSSCLEFNLSTPIAWMRLTLRMRIPSNIKHCEASVSKQYTTALNCYIAKALPVKYQITAHRLWHIGKQGLSLHCLWKCLTAYRKLSQLQRIACHGVVPYNGDICPTCATTLANCRLSLNTDWLACHAWSLLEAS